MSYHVVYERMSASERKIIDSAYTALRRVLVEAGERVSNTDAAEVLVEAIAEYVVASREEAARA